MIQNILVDITNSKIFGGFVMIMMNIGSKYIILDLPKNLDKIFTKIFILRILVVFCIFFMATKDIIISILLTLIFVIFIRFILNEKSNFCLLNNCE